MPLLVDGNNLAFRLTGRADRSTVRRRVLDLVRGQRVSVTVVFDGPPPEGSPAHEALGRVTVVYSGKRSADDAIVARIPPGTGARNVTVVTDDQGLARRARARGAKVVPASQWIARLPRSPKKRAKPKVDRPLSAAEIARWEAFFSGPREPGDED